MAHDDHEHERLVLMVGASSKKTVHMFKDIIQRGTERQMRRLTTPLSLELALPA